MSALQARGIPQQQQEELAADAIDGNRKAQRLLDGAGRRVALFSYNPYRERMRKMGASNIDASQPCPKVAESHTRARRTIIHYVENIIAEMAIVFRNHATTILVFSFVCVKR